MFDILRKYINQYSSGTLSEEEFALIKQAFKPKKIRKRQYFLQEGDVCRYGGFIAKGAMRQYSVDVNGHEHVISLGIETWWMVDHESFIMLTPSKYNIDAVEDTDLLLISNESMLDLKSKISAIRNMVEVMDQRNFIATQRRLHSAISYSAEDRYTELLNTYPAMFQRFPQNMIASYLGITAETLSRVRKQIQSKQKSSS